VNTGPYRVHPLLLGEAEVGRALDVFWSLTKESGRVTVPILAFLIEGAPEPILVDTGMRDPVRAMGCTVSAHIAPRPNGRWKHSSVTMESSLRT